MAGLDPTQEQQHIIEASAQPDRFRQINVVAVAGSGKTATLEQINDRNPVDTVYIVADSSSRREAQQRFGPNVAVHTGHSLAFQALIAPDPGLQAKFEAANKGLRIPFKEMKRWVDLEPIQQAGGVNHFSAAASVIALLNGFQNSRDLHIKPEHLATENLPKRLRRQDDESLHQSFREAVHKGTCDLWSAMVHEPDCPILHGTYLKWLQLDKPVFGWQRWFCDEFQDANPVIADIIEQQTHAQIIRVGDPSQQVYSWRGAINALDYDDSYAEQRHDFTLSQSFRFGPRIAATANQVLRFAGRDQVVEGVGRDGENRINYSKPLTIVARNNITLFHHAVQAMNQGHSVAMQGGINQVASLIRSAHALYHGDKRRVSAPELREYNDWEELKQVASIGQDPMLSQLKSVIELSGDKAVENVEHLEKASANTRFDGVDRLLTTVHQAKGSEWDQVWLAGDLAIPDKLINDCYEGKELSAVEKERFNALYVAITRARETLEMAPKLRASFRHMVSLSDEVERHGYQPMQASNNNVDKERKALGELQGSERDERIRVLSKIYGDDYVAQVCAGHSAISKAFERVMESEIDRMMNDVATKAVGPGLE